MYPLYWTTSKGDTFMRYSYEFKIKLLSYPSKLLPDSSKSSACIVGNPAGSEFYSELSNEALIG